MSKPVLVAAVAAVMALGGCFSGQTETAQPVKAAPEPIPEPVYVEPVATKKY